MKTKRTVYTVYAGRNQHSTWFSHADALACVRILFKRGRTGLKIAFN